MTFNQTHTRWQLNSNVSNTTNTILDRDFQPSSFEIVAVILIILGSLVGNHLIFFAFVNNVKMRTVTNTMVVNMCIVDIVTVLGDVPFYFLPRWIHPQLAKQYAFCRFCVFMYNFSTVAAILSMLCIAVDRYLNLVQTSFSRLSLKRAKFMIGFVWLQALIAALPWGLLTSVSRSPDLLLFLCQRLPYIYSPGLNIRGLSIVLKISYAIVPHLIIGWAFGQILQFARRRRKVKVHDTSAICRSKTETFAVHSYARYSVTAILLFTIYLISATPFVISVVYTLFKEYTDVTSTFALTVFYFHRLRGAVLPFMYLSRNRNVLAYFQSKVKKWHEKKDYPNQRTITSIRFHRTKSGNESRFLNNGTEGRYKLGTTTTKIQSQSPSMQQAARCRVFYTKDAKRELHSSFTDLSSVHNESRYSKVVIESWSKVITVEEAEATVHKLSTIDIQSVHE